MGENRTVQANQARPFQDKAFEEAWYALQRKLWAAIDAAGDVKIEGVCFVGPDGDNGTAQPDSLKYKYQTVQAAVDAALAVGPAGNPRAVALCPGVYPESVQLPATFSTCVIASLFGKSATIQPSAVDQPAIRYTAGAGGFGALVLWELGLTADINDSNLATVLVDCTAESTGGMLLIDGCTLFNQAGSASPSLAAKRVAGVAATDSEFRSNLGPGNALVLSQCNAGEFDLCLFRGRFEDGYNAANPVPPGGRGTTSITRSKLERIEAIGNARVEASYCIVQSEARGTLDDANGGTSGRLSFAYCELQGGTVLDCTYSGNETASFSHHNKHSQGLSLIQNNAGTGIYALFNNDVFTSGGNINSGSDCEIDIRGSDFVELNLFGPGAISRDWVTLLAVQMPVGPEAAPAAGGPWTFNPPLGFGTPYDVVWQGDAGGTPGTVVEYLGQSNLGFSTQATAPLIVAPTTTPGKLRVLVRR